MGVAINTFMIVHLLVAAMLSFMDVTRVDAHQGVDEVARVGCNGKSRVDHKD